MTLAILFATAAAASVGPPIKVRLVSPPAPAEAGETYRDWAVLDIIE